MNTTNNNADLQKLMNRAWAMHRETNVSLGACMRKAWELVRLGKALHRKGVTTIIYKKKDGTTRKALATLNVGPGVFSAFRREESPKVFTYWDLQKGAFRCFRCESLIAWY